MWKIHESKMVITMFSLLIFGWGVVGLSDKRLCADLNCQTTISIATAKINYNAGKAGMVSFKINSNIRVMSKSAGIDESLWGIEVNGRQGYAPKEFIKETKVYVNKKNLIEVPVVLPGVAPKPVATLEKPVDVEEAVPILNASENIELKGDIEVTTTVPLDLSLNIPDVPPILTGIEQSEAVTQAPQASPVEASVEIIDGTKIPQMMEVTTVKNEKLNKNIVNDVLKEYDDYEDEETREPPLLDSKAVSAKDENEGNIHKTKQNLEEIDGVISTESNDEKNDDDNDDDNDDEDVDDVKKNEKDDKVGNVEIVKPLPKQEETTTANTPEVVQPTSGSVDVPERKTQATKLEESKGDITTNSEIFQTTVESFTKAKKEELEPIKAATEIVNVETVQPEHAVSRDTSSKEDMMEAIANILQSTDDQEEQTTIETNKIEINTEEPVSFNENANVIPKEENEVKPIAENTSTEISQNEQQQKSTDVLSENNTNQLLVAEKVDEIELDTTSNEIKQETEAQTPLSVASNETSTLVTPLESDYTTVSTHDFHEVPILDEKYEELETTTATVTAKEPEVKDTTTKPIMQDFVSTELPPLQQEVAANQQTQKEETIKGNSVSANDNKFENPNDYYREREKQYADYISTQYAAPPLPLTNPTEATELPVLQQETFSPQIFENTKAEDSGSTTGVNIGIGSIESAIPTTERPTTSDDPVALPSKATLHNIEIETKERGLFATILGTVNSLISTTMKKETVPTHQGDDSELQRILFPERHRTAKNEIGDEHYCEKLNDKNCPTAYQADAQHVRPSIAECEFSFDNLSLDNFLQMFASKILEMSQLLACLAIAATSSLFFIFGYYCFCNSSREGALLSKLNQLERSLLASHKENSILRDDLMKTRSKLSSIEDNSFGSNDMVISLKKELEEELLEKGKLQEQINNLEKELENAAEAGLELNKIVSELLSNQTGDESIISSVEELQRQLNEQQNTTLEINANLAEKSRENSELQLMIAEQNARLGGEIASLQQDNDELEAEKSNLQTRLEEIKSEFEEDITKALKGKNSEIKRLQNEIIDLKTNWDNEHAKRQTSMAKVEALEECLKSVKRDPNVNISKVIDVAHVRAELLDIQKKHNSLKERFDAESDAHRLSQNQLQIATGEVEKLKQDFHQSEKDKLEAQTRLEVLSNYFKDKETQLQKELSLKETMWLQQQGETTSTVDRLTTMQEEIQSLKSQNDALRAEIEAQLAAHKAQTGTLENRAHETWLAARQSERRYEESRAEATALRHKLTALAGGNPNEGNRVTTNTNVDGKLTADMNNAPSPIHMESPGSPLLGRMPPPPFLPPFMGPPPPFLGMPPPPFVPSIGGPPPLGRLMSPPPPTSHAGHFRRYSPDRGDDYDDYEDDDDDDIDVDDDDEALRHRRRSGGDNSWHRDTYSSPPRTYRSHSPTDYDYADHRDLMSTYDTETDFSPPPSPRDRRGRDSRASYKAYSPQPTPSSPVNENNNKNHKNKSTNSSNKKSSSSTNKGILSSGSEKSYNSSHKKGKSLV